MFRIGNEMLKWIKNNLPKGSTILELGSGDGTKLLLEAGYKLISIENNPEYFGKYHDDYILAKLHYEWYDREAIVHGLYQRQYDLIIVDGPKGSIARMGFWDNRDLFDLSVPIIVDDTVRSVEKEMVERFRGIGFTAKNYIDGRKSFAVLMPEVVHADK
jgi:hypothetical protein